MTIQYDDPQLQAWVDAVRNGGVKNSMNKFTGDGVKTVYDVNFAGGYLYKADIRAYKVSPANAKADVTVTAVDGNRVTLSAPVEAGWTLVIYRDTPKNAPLVDFSDNSIVNERNLDTNFQQAIFSVAEMLDRFDDTVTFTLDAYAAAAQASASATSALASSQAAAESASSAAFSASAAATAATQTAASQSAASTSASQAASSQLGAATSAGTAVQAANTAAGAADVATAKAAAAAASAAAADVSALVAQNVGGVAWLPAGLAAPVPFAAGIVAGSSPTTTVVSAGKLYAAKLSALPFTTSSVFNSAQWEPVTGVSRQELGQASGASLVGFAHTAAGAKTVATSAVLSGFIYPQMFATLQAAVDYAASSRKVLAFPAGAYTYATSPNFAVTNLQMLALGTVTFEHTGSGRAFLMDAGAGSVYNIQMLGDFAVKGNADTDVTGGVFVRAIQHSSLKLRAYDMPGVAYLVNFAVLSDMDFTCSVNQQAFSITPTKGIVLDKRNDGEYVADCRLNLVMEGIGGLGVDFVDVQGCLITGTTEGNAAGFRDSATCADNTFIGFWCEVNQIRDFELYGLRSRFINSKSISAVAGANCEVVTAVGTVFSGGFWRHVNLQSTSSGTLFDGVALSDNAALGITGAGSYKSINSYKVDVNGNKTAVIKDVVGESGSWTPTLVGSGGTSNHTYSVQEGSYYDVGGIRHFQARLVVSTKDSGMTGSVAITGLGVAGVGTYASGVVGIHGNLAASGGRAQVGWYIAPGTGAIQLSNVNTAAADTLVDASQVESGTRLFISGQYVIR